MKKRMTVLCLLLVSSFGFGCSQTDRSDRSKISKDLETQIQNNNWERIDLAQVGGAAWRRVCVLGPYSGNNRAEETLGFKWDLEQKTSALSSDGATLLVFVEGKEVVAYAEHPRNLGDFSSLSDQCFDRGKAKFVRDKTRKDNWVSFVAEK